MKGFSRSKMTKTSFFTQNGETDEEMRSNSLMKINWHFIEEAHSKEVEKCIKMEIKEQNNAEK